MKSAEEMAFEIHEHFHAEHQMSQNCLTLIRDALNEFAGERVKEAYAKTYSQGFIDVRRDARADSLEEAAEIIEKRCAFPQGSGCTDCEDHLDASNIRALKDAK
jgi:hypothetical protein